MFYDLNIQRPDTNEEDNLKLIISRGVKFGYKGFAVTTNLDESIFEKNKKEKSKKSNSNETSSVIPLPLDLKVFKTLYPNLYFFNRINIRISQGSNLRKFTQCKNLKKYELVSFQPENQDVLKALTGIPAINILSFDPINKWDFTFNRKLYNQFVNQNVYFELMYSPGIIDSSARKNLFTVSHMYRAVGKSKNIIVTSGASAPHHIRSPYDKVKDSAKQQ
ncbi:Ribonuclease P protein subunit p30, putative [Pediculus humanus corporis]|uniref:Ribonuclease P protein subunit p30, putative n=1 Tax=Pediculus humanus subsp. corporis TaxID=121224 RepID=E0VJQ4_PEDHC|nr:Ribonuclease P protein subunit p30, putative [Pediculus humanus corporis]EEB13610.1 Ribonuclease P protein subunit p30, putative [Pediculus humanus corporis]